MVVTERRIRPAASLDCRVGGTSDWSDTLLGETVTSGVCLTDQAFLPGCGGSLIRIVSSASRTRRAVILAEGFTIGGSTSKTVLIRASGPALTAYGVTGVMPDPQLAVYNAAETVIASNAGWGGDSQITTIANSVYAFPLTNRTSTDSAVVLTLAPGSYTAIATSVSGVAGVALVEVYEVP